MLQVDNRSPYATSIAPLPDEDGVESIFVAIKATFAWDGAKVRVAPEPEPVHPADIWSGEPGRSSLAYASDLAFEKPEAEYVLSGSAVAPEGREVDGIDVGVRVGDLEKFAAVAGDREWRDNPLGAIPSRPRPFTRLPLTWERAFGGTDSLKDGERFRREERNPVGTGFFARGGTRRLEDSPPPNVEAPGAPMKSIGDRPRPTGFGPLCAHWKDRGRWAGTYDATWEETRAPYLPEDFDLRYFQVAPEDQRLGEEVRAGLEVRLMHLTPRGREHFAVPAVTVRCVLVADGDEVELHARCDTLILRPDEARFSLLWHARHPCDKRTLRVERIVIDAETRGVEP